MDVRDKVAVVTGAAGGIGAALARALAAAGARVVLVDRDADRVRRVVADIETTHAGHAVAADGDISDEAVVAQVVELARRSFGPVDLYCANAGVGGTASPGVSDEEDWELSLQVNLLAHIRAARLLVPEWLERGSGYFLSTASAAGLLTQLGSAPYSVTKHGAVAFAEWLSVTYGDRGIRVSCLCPMGVNTDMLNAGRAQTDGLAAAAARQVTSSGAVLEPEDVAQVVLAGIAAEHFLILPHPEVLTFFQRKGSDYDRWLAGMRRLQVSLG
ncbi:MAG TPA: SDR family oxidoreductase [Mycobacteriales bacterium]|jgi:hypothetical protein|nr:SDR family oxidoreductase [Mycobacteriales bacterium]